jgi:multidrug efflux pump subunit AcrB
MSVLREAIIGALLTGLTLLLFLRDWRSSLIVVITIPFALLTAVVLLKLSGQTINIMTLGGLALAVGVLVDEGTVLLENIHVHLDRGENTARAVHLASREVAVPRLLAMLCVMAVFIPSFFMTGPAQSLFLPLSLAVGFAMGASYLLSSSLVPVLANWMLKPKSSKDGDVAHTEGSFDRFRHRFERALVRAMSIPARLLSAYGIIALLVLLFVAPRIAEEIFPSAASTQFRLRIDAPDGTRVAVTEDMVKRVLASIREVAGEKNLDLSLGYVGTQGSSYPINAVFLWTSGPQQAIINVGLKQDSSLKLADLEEQLRKKLPQQFPDAHFSFDPGDLISQILSFGSSSIAEVAITGPQYADVASYAERVRQKLAAVPELRDLGYEEPQRYPTVDIKVNRAMAGQLGTTADAVGSAVVSATASSRFVAPSYWRDPRSGVSYQVQVQVPQPKMTSLGDIGNIPVGSTTGAQPLVNQLADLRSSTVPGELDRLNGQWMLALSANLGGQDLRLANRAIKKALSDAGAPPRGVKTEIRGQVSAMQQIFGQLSIGLLAAIGVILLLLTANFQSLKLSLIVLSTVPAVLTGSVLMLLMTGTTLNLESFMGTIMAIGVAVANAILLVSFAEQNRRKGASAPEAARAAATERLRPVLMTSLAMIAGMIPMAIAFGQGSEETAPLGRAVIGGLAVATVATLFLLPMVFGLVQRNASTGSRSLDPEDPDSQWFEQSPEVAR